MARKRLQQKGDLYKQGGWWKLRWKEDQVCLEKDGERGTRYAWSKPVSLGPCDGNGRLTEKQARRIAWENFLSRLDQNMRTPQSIMTVREFVERKFTPEHVAMLKTSGRVHYEQMLPHALDGIPVERRSFKGHKKGQELPELQRRCGIGALRVRDVGHEDVQRLVSEAILRGYSVQTAKHIRTCVSAIFTHAERAGWFTGRNPAHFVELPEMVRRPERALSFEELNAFLLALKPLARAMVLCAALTSMNIAEVCGLRWKRLNLGLEPVVVDGESIPSHYAVVREQWYRREFGTVKAKARRRNVPMGPRLVEALCQLKAVTVLRGPEDVVFAGKSGRPVDAGAMLKRQLRRAAAGIGVPKLGWHDLRRTFATLADELHLTIGERKALMGHSRAEQTLAYTHTHSEQAVAALERFDVELGKFDVTGKERVN